MVFFKHGLPGSQCSTPVKAACRRSLPSAPREVHPPRCRRHSPPSGPARHCSCRLGPTAMMAHTRYVPAPNDSHCGPPGCCSVAGGLSMSLGSDQPYTDSLLLIPGHRGSALLFHQLPFFFSASLLFRSYYVSVLCEEEELAPFKRANT